MDTGTSGRTAGGRPWLLAALLLAVVFVAGNFPLVDGRVAPTWDAEALFFPAFTLIADHARVGKVALWNPWQSGGSPEYAEPQLGTASPVAVLVGAITGGTESGFRVYWLLIWFLGPLGILVLARHFGAPPWAGFIVALGFAFSGFYTGHGEHTSSLYAFSFLPWVLWRFDLAVTSGRLRYAAEAGALWGFSALGGFPEFTILSGGFLFLWALGRWCCGVSGERTTPETASEQRPRPRVSFSVLALALVLLVGVLVLAPSYVAFFLEGAGYSDRVGPRSREEAVGSGAIEAGALTTFASPYLTTLKLHKNPKLWPTSDVSVTNVYLGALIPILALLAMLYRPKSRWRWWLVAVAAFFLACAVGTQLPLRGWLYDYFPPTRYFRHPGLFRPYSMLCAAVLALLATKDLDGALRESSQPICRLFAFAAVYVATVAVAAYAHVISTVEDVGPWLHRADKHLAWIWLGSIGVSLLVLHIPKTRKLLPILLGILAIIDAGQAIRLARPVVSVSRGSSWPPLTRVNANHNASLDLTPNGLKREVRTPLWLGGARTNETVPMKVATFSNNYETMTNRFQMDFEQRPVLVGMSTGTDRIWFSSDVMTFPPTDTFYAAFVKRSEALGAPVLVIHAPEMMREVRQRGVTTPLDAEGVQAISQLPAAQRVPAKVPRYTPNHLDLEISAPRDGWLLVTDRWARGWRAKVNGQPAQVFGGDFIFRAVRVKAGENKAEFDYHPAGWPILLILSWGTLVMVFAGPHIVPKQLRNALLRRRMKHQR